jgi:hypothetical protein
MEIIQEEKNGKDTIAITDSVESGIEELQRDLKAA